MSYVFDTSSMIGAWVRSYPPDHFPGVWYELDSLIDAGRLVAPDEVLSELRAQDDGLHRWVVDRTDKMILPTTRAVMLEARAILADHPFLTKTGTGRAAADPFVIAVASMQGLVVVTQELGGTIQKPRIPFVCQERGIQCIPFLEVIRLEGWTFGRGR
jgi:Domain of unknown function (DUF4411)